MSGTDRQTKSPRPHGTGGSSVPVLFSLRNVQPNIVGGAKANASAISDSTVAKTSTPSPQTMPVSSTLTVAMEAPLARPVAPQPKGNRSYNIVVGILVIAVCLLVIKNTQRNNASSRTEVASKTDAPKPVSLPANSVTQSPLVASIPNTTIKPTDSSTMVLGAAPVSIPPLPSTSSFPGTSSNLPKLENSESVAINASTSSIVSESRSLQELNAYQSQSADTTNQPIPTNPSSTLPMLLTSSKPDASNPSIPALPSANKNNEVPSLEFPDARTARAPETLRTSSSPTTSPANPANLQPLDLNSPSVNRPSDVQGQAVQPAATTPLVDSNLPYATTKEMQEVKYRHDQNILSVPGNIASTSFPASQSNGPGIPASSVSSVGAFTPSTVATVPNASLTSYSPIGSSVSNSIPNSIPNNTVPNGSGTVLSGSPYPPLPKENPTPTVRPYEQGGLMNPAPPTSGTAGATAPNGSQSIRQPASTSGNRYAPPLPQTSTAPVPYKPLNNTGYPPGNGN